MSKNGQVRLDHLQILRILQVTLAKLENQFGKFHLPNYKLKLKHEVEEK